jgi:hypothetical protein
MFHSIRWRVAIIFVVVVVVCMGGLGAYMVQFVNDSYLEHLRAQSINQAYIAGNAAQPYLTGQQNNIKDLVQSLEAWQISVVPLRSAAIPAPEPGPLTAIFTFGCIFMKSSAQILVSGVTVLDPITLKVPERPPSGAVVDGLVVAGCPHPASKTATITSTDVSNIALYLLDLLIMLSLL